MKDKKRSIGQYYTRGNPFILTAFRIWSSKFDLHKQIVLEPFAGAKNIPELIELSGIKCGGWKLYDIEPASDNVVYRDTIQNFPKSHDVCITNPPWLARNSATRRGLPFPETKYDDLYKHALEKCLDNCKWVAAIIPESFIRSGVLLDRLSDFISLVPDDYIDSLFDDTQHPTGLALFSPSTTSDIILWRNNYLIGGFKRLQSYMPKHSDNRNIVFNDPDGNVGLIAIDNTVSASIRFCDPIELGDYKVNHQRRFITKIRVPYPVDIDVLNKTLSDIRERTHDVFLTAFKGVRKDGYYRRRLHWGLARSIISENIGV